MRNPDVNLQPGPDCGGDMEDPETKPANGTSSAARNAWSRIRSHYLVSLTSSRPQLRRPVNRTHSAAARALHGLKFISNADENAAAAWTAVARRFDELTCSMNGLLPHSRFAECIGMKESKEFAGALLKAVARRRCITEDSINKELFKEIWDHIIDQGFHSRLQIFFDMVDRDADGTISEEEIKEIISWSASANKLPNIQKQSDEYARLIMEEFDPKGHGHIMIEDLEMLLLQAPSHNISTASAIHRNLSKMMSEKLRPTEGPAMKRWWIRFWYFLIDNWRRVWVVALWIGAMAGLFGYKYTQYRRKAALFNVMGHCVCMAKGAAETLKLNMALILLPVCRNTITWLRSKTFVGTAVPLGDNINFHKIIAVAIAIGVAIHSMGHLVCDYPRLLHASPEEFGQMERYLKHQPTSYWYFVKGCEGVTGIAMVILMTVSYTLASPCFRRNRVKLPKPLDKLAGYNAFWYSHHLFVIVYVALVVHGIQLYFIHEWYKKTTWMYFAIPVTLYAGERLTRILRSNINHVKILKVELYPGDVLLLHLSKPPGFDYKSGQYIVVKCPAVSPFEWHPFSITSAPMDDYISVHIRILGDWTRQLKAVFTEGTTMQEKNSPNFPKVLIDGPYGAPTQDYKDYDVVLLVGLGIGATPMISVVKDIVNGTKRITKDHEEAMEEGRMTTRHDSFKTKKAYFYWVARESGWFDWFKNVMDEVSEMDERGLSVIEMHSYCTSIYEEGDVRSALIAMLQSLSHAKNGVDIVSGTRVKSHFAKPKWRDVFKGLALNHPNSRIGVFYCGLPTPVEELKRLASLFSHKTSTEFEFHKENF